MYAKSSLLLLGLITIFPTHVSAGRIFGRQQTVRTTNVSVAEKPIIIFDIVNILFKESYVGFAQKIGYGTLASYALAHWKNPGHRCLDMLHAISSTVQQKPHVSIVLQGKTMPKCIVELHEGKKKCCEVQAEIAQEIERLNNEKFFVSNKEKNLMLTIMNLMLDPQVLSSITEPIKPMMALVQKLKQSGYALYICANMPEEYYAMLTAKYPSFVALFDGIVVSSQLQTAKPSACVFEHLLSSYKLDPKQCIVIDNCKHNTQAAESLGMRAVVYDKHSGLISYLKGQGVMVL